MKQEIRAHFGFIDLAKDLASGKKKIGDLIAKGPMDITFLALVIALLTIGIVMMFSASYVNAWYDSSPTVDNDPFYYVKNQVLFALIGLALMIAVSFIKSDVFRDVSGLITVIALLLLVYVLINPYIIPGKEQFKRWVEFPIIGSFQPSEIAKLALIMFLAFNLERNHKLIEKQWWTILPYMGVILVFCGLVYLENHVSGTLLMLGIGAATVYFGGVRIHWSIYVLGVAAILIPRRLRKQPNCNLAQASHGRRPDKRRSAGQRLAESAVALRYRLGRSFRSRLRQFKAKAYVSSRTAERLRVCGCLRRTRLFKSAYYHFTFYTSCRQRIYYRSESKNKI